MEKVNQKRTRIHEHSNTNQNPYVVFPLGDKRTQDGEITVHEITQIEDYCVGLNPYGPEGNIENQNKISI